MMNYAAAYEAALAKFRAVSLESMAEHSGYSLEGQCLKVDFLGQEFTVEYPTGRFDPEPSPQGELPIFAQILVLHYLANVSEVVEEGKLISYKELPGGGIYIQPFTNRAINPLVKAYGENPERLLEVALKYNGQAAKHGDVSVTLRVFPRIPVTLVLWRGDDEFPASGTILFDASAPYLLPTEDYAVLAGFIVATMKNNR